jgi:hypothetical protein
VPSVGDSLRDLEASAAFGAQPILVKTGKGECTIKNGGLPAGTWICDDLAQAVQRIIAEDRSAQEKQATEKLSREQPAAAKGSKAKKSKENR